MVKKNFTRRLIIIITTHPWLKVISLLIAILLWFYIQGEINRFDY